MIPLKLTEFFDGKSDYSNYEKNTLIVKEGRKEQISWRRHPKYDEILRKHYFALNGRNYASKVLIEIGVSSTIGAIHARAKTLGLYQELQIRKAEEFITKKPLSQKQRLIIKQWRYFNDLFYSDIHYLQRPGIYEIRNKALDVYYVGYTLHLFYRLYYGYARPEQSNKKYIGNMYIINLIKKHSINGFQFRVLETYHKFDEVNRFFRDDGTFNESLLNSHWKYRESIWIHKLVDKGIRLINQLENPHFQKNRLKD